MKRLILLLLLSSPLVFANACASNGVAGNWTVPANWTSCGGTIPQPGDTVAIGGICITLNTSTNVVSITLTFGGCLKVDGAAPHTLTCTGTTGCIITTSSGPATNLDTSAGSASNLLTIIAASTASGSFVIDNNQSQGQTTNLQWVQITSSNVQPVVRSESGSLQISHCNFSNTGIVASLGFTNPFTFTFNTMSSITGNTIELTGPSVGPSVTIDDNTETNPLTNGSYFFHNVETANASGWDLSRNALMDTVSIGKSMLLSTSTNTGSSPTTITYNIGKSLIDASTGIDGFTGISASRIQVGHNVLDGYNQEIAFIGFLQSSFNFGVQTSAAAGGQGIIFTDQATTVSSSNDIMTFDSVNGNFAFFAIGNGGPATVTVTNDTIYGLLSATMEVAYTFGEIGTNLNVTGSSLSNSITTQTPYGVLSGNAANVFTTGGTGGVGVYNNDVFSAASAPYTLVAGGTNFGSGHPSATYGDVTLDPQLAAPTRRMQNCDLMWGGPGTLADLYSQLALRWNGSNDARFTPQNVWQCVAQAYAPQNVKLATAGSGGSLIGAMPVVSLISAVPQ